MHVSVCKWMKACMWVSTCLRVEMFIDVDVYMTVGEFLSTNAAQSVCQFKIGDVTQFACILMSVGRPMFVGRWSVLVGIGAPLSTDLSLGIGVQKYLNVQRGKSKLQGAA